MYGQQVVVSKEAAAEIKEAIEWVAALDNAVAKAVISGDKKLAKDLFIQHENAQLNIRMVLKAHGLPVPALRCKVKLPF